jgi:hypothetical protein
VAFFVAFFDLAFVAFFDLAFVDFFDFGAFLDFGVDFFVVFAAFFDFFVDFFVEFFDLGFLDLDFEAARAPNPWPTHISSIPESSLFAGILLFGIVLSDFRLFPGLFSSILGLWALTLDGLDFFGRLDLVPLGAQEALEAVFGGILGFFLNEKAREKKTRRAPK